VVLVSTYELGRQPFGLASPAAWIRGAGHQGLANMRGRAHALGGELSVDSRPGAGTRIILSLPPRDPEGGADRQPVSSVRPGSPDAAEAQQHP
jgi:hypothetical protein